MAGIRDKVLEFALSLPEATEDHPWGEDVAKVRGKILVFCSPPASRRMTVKLAESHAHALSVDGVLDARSYRRPGFVFGELRRGADRAGFLLAAGSSRDDALARADRAAEYVRFETADAAASVL